MIQTETPAFTLTSDCPQCGFISITGDRIGQDDDAAGAFGRMAARLLRRHLAHAAVA